MKKLCCLIFAGVISATSFSAMAGAVPGDVNFGTDASYNNDSVQYALVFVNDNNVTTAYTGCVAPGTGYAQGLTVSAMNGHSGKVKVQAHDCYYTTLNAKTTSTFDYDPSKIYYVACTTKYNGGTYSVECNTTSV